MANPKQREWSGARSLYAQHGDRRRGMNGRATKEESEGKDSDRKMESRKDRVLQVETRGSGSWPQPALFRITTLPT